MKLLISLTTAINHKTQSDNTARLQKITNTTRNSNDKLSFISLCTTELPQEQTIQTFCLNSSQSEERWLKKKIALKGKERKCPVSDTAWIQGLDKGLVHNEERMFGPWTIQSRNKIMELEISITGLPDVLRTMRRTKLQFFVNLILLRNYIHKKRLADLKAKLSAFSWITASKWHHRMNEKRITLKVTWQCL